MNITIVGYGKMGRMIEEEALRTSNNVVAIIDPLSSDKAVTGGNLTDISPETDVVMDFSSPSSAVGNILYYAEASISAVIGTTGWYSHLDELIRVIDTSRCSIIYSGNYSIGVALLMRSVEYISRLMDSFPSYDIAIEEIHHKRKADCPSGTAEMLKDIIIKNITRKKSAVYGNPEGVLDSEELEISSLRLGSVNGVHTVIFDSPVDTLTLTHSAKSRAGFASGALLAAEWINGRSGFFSMDDFLSDFLGGV